MYIPLLKNRVNGCHGNHAFFIVQFRLSLIFFFFFFFFFFFCISGVPMNALTSMKNCPGVQGRSNYLPGYLLYTFKLQHCVRLNKIHVACGIAGSKCAK